MSRRVLVVSLALVAVAALLWVRAPSSHGKSAAKTPAPTAATPAPARPSPSQPGLRAAAGDDDGDDDAPKPSRGPVFFARWGGAPGELGRERPPEGNPVGPMSFAADSRGRLTVLDGVNGRLVRRGPDGRLEQSFPIDVVNPEDVAVGPGGESAVLDRHRDKAVAVYDESGKLRGKLPLEGEGVADPGSVTGVFVDGQDVYVEREHGPLVKVGDLSGAPAAPRSELPGRPSRDGKSLLKAGIIEAPAGRVYVTSMERTRLAHRFTRELRLPSEVHMIALLDSDRAGTIYFAAEVAAGEVLLYCIDGATGVPSGSTSLPANTLPEESMRDFVVLDAGGVIQSLRSEAGVSYERYDCG